MPVETRSYRQSDCVAFRKTADEFGALSNMAPGFPLTVNRIPIRTSEALYQLCRFPLQRDVQQLIVDERSPMTAKMKSKPYRHLARPDWTMVRVRIMRWCLRVKLAQHWDAFGEILLATGDSPIVEDSRKDDFWGAKPSEDGCFNGRNVLGRLLMELRQALRAHPEQLVRVAPPEVSNCLLLGETIGQLERVARGPLHLRADDGRAPTLT